MKRNLTTEWKTLRPTETELKLVWAALVKCKFLIKEDNEAFDPNFRASSKSRKQAPFWMFWEKDECKFAFTHTHDLPDSVIDWEW